ncbi:MAG: hypothetical protein HYV63_16465 [Candidatus Schekmanbacteria bacterium]|nr:hypothetical protein [Candidatus Schekmanbacteria bacterium]
MSDPGRTASTRYRELERLPGAELDRLFLQGSAPDPMALAARVFRGVNTPAFARLLGIKKFMKGFWRAGDAVFGYNCPVRQNGLDEPWLAKPSDDAPKRFGHYKVSRVDPVSRDSAYLHAILLDYGRGGNPLLDPSRGLRDYLVRVAATDEEIYLGKAYFALGPARVAVSYFLLEPDRSGPAERIGGNA